MTTLFLSSVPDGARIFVNGQLKADATPAVVKVPPGAVRLRLEHAGYAPREVEMILPAGEKILHEKLTPQRGKKRIKGVKVIVRGAGVRKTARSNGRGVAVLRINPKKPGLITVTARETKQRICGPKRIGVVGVFLPPLTG